MIIAIVVGAIVGVFVGCVFPDSGLSEYLTELLIQTCCAGVGFAAGTLWMRENYIDHITEMQDRIKELENKENYYERNCCNF